MILGIEFGSTRIKSVLIDQNAKVVCQGGFEWENTLADGLWSYPLEDAIKGLQVSYQELANNYEKQFGQKLKRLDAIGISGMMHGYIALDKDDKLLAPFRTWRNTNTGAAAGELSELFQFNIPLRWSVSQYYESVLEKMEHVSQIHFLTTLAGFIHYLLSGKKVLGIDEASGMFPVAGRDYDADMLAKFDDLLAKNEFVQACGIKGHFKDLLPAVLLAGENAGYLTEAGARLLDPTGALEAGCPLCPPEGDMGTGMVCTNCVAPKKANTSCGTSANLTVIMEKPLQHYYKEIDVVDTPDGHPAALIHTNNCTSEINAWVRMFKEILAMGGVELDNGELYGRLFKESLKSDANVGDLSVYNFSSGEPLAGAKDTCLMTVRKETDLSLANFMQAQIYSAIAPLSLSKEILDREGVEISEVIGHGGYFKTDYVGQSAFSATIGAPCTVVENAGEGGAWGIALLALYMDRLSHDKNMKADLQAFLDDIFKDAKSSTLVATAQEQARFKNFITNYRKNIQAVYALDKPEGAKGKADSADKSAAQCAAPCASLTTLKQRVLEQNLRLVKEGLVVLTWGNVSAIDREAGLVAIKPSGVDYAKMTVDDIVVTDLDGKVVEGSLRPSSDLPTHLELYKAFPEIGAVVHTHSTFATAYAQAGLEIPVGGTTHADAFYGSVPVTRALNEQEIANDYEKNTGLVIAETFKNKDENAVPGVLVKNHGVFTWGPTVEKATENAVTLEAVAKMEFVTKTLNPSAEDAPQYLQDKHYFRKHGKNAYYGQK